MTEYSVVYIHSFCNSEIIVSVEYNFQIYSNKVQKEN
jgi:hypothetical protein